MIYTPLTKKAMRLAYEAHAGQVDKTGMPYIFHPYHLAEGMADEIAATVALLHDVVEDTEYTLSDLAKMGYPREVTDALALLTHDEAVPYMDYVREIAKNPVARAVKIADLTHNSDLTRLDEVDEAALRRRERYAEALRILRDEE